ncbi:MAG: glucosamine-6-phosphate deaminase [Kiritimatiellae bacterium]|nr:glucosamine-6-phosphate deaminase [Kiritimatiellia bacterium]
MEIVVFRDPGEVGQYAAQMFARQLRSNPKSVLGLATGSTPIPLYRELIRMHRMEGLDFSEASSFNLDEYIGLAPDHPQSFRHFMQTELFDHVNIRPERTHVPDGLAVDVEVACAAYEAAIAAAGGIDIQVLGLGANGHIGFNEPHSAFDSRTQVQPLTERTILDNARFFASSGEVPRRAITMGIGTIMESRACLLLATGSAKAEAVARMIEGPVSEECPASILQRHTNATILLDELAAARLSGVSRARPS